MKTKTYQELIESEYFSFFHCQEIESTNENEIIIKKVKPGGFQEHIDMEFYLNKSSEIIKAKLLLDRVWIGNVKSVNLFANDITKSFVKEIASNENKQIIDELAYLIYNLRGLEDTTIAISPVTVSYVSLPFDIRKILDVYLGEYQEMDYDLSNSNFAFKNISEKGKKRFLIEWQTKNE